MSLKEILVKVIKSGRTPALWGPPGIGKTSIMEESGREMGLEIRILDCTTLGTLDLLCRVPNYKKGTLEEFPNEVFIGEGERPRLIILDDLTLAHPEVAKSLLKVVFERRVGHRQLANCYFGITGNRPEDKTRAWGLLSTFTNRIVSFYMRPDLEGWLQWAIRDGKIEERIIKFLICNPSLFFEEPSEDSFSPFATPRSWHILSDVIRGINDLSAITTLADGTVGRKISTLFVNFIKFESTLRPEEYLNEPKLLSSLKREEIYLVFLNVTELLLNKEVAPEKIRKFWEFSMNNGFGEFNMIIFRYASGKNCLNKIIDILGRSGINTKNYLKEVING